MPKKRLEKPDFLNQETPKTNVPWFKQKISTYSAVFVLGILLSTIIFQSADILKYYWLFIVGFFLIVPSFLAIWLLPIWQAKILDQMKGGEDQSEFDLSKERIKLRDDLRKTVAQIIAGLFFLLNVLVAYNTLSLNTEGLQTDRFAKTMGLLNDKSETIRKGSLVTLDRISKESVEYHPRIMDILASYIREKSAEQRIEFQELNKLTPYQLTTQNTILPAKDDILLAFDIIRNSKIPTQVNLKKANFSQTDFSKLVLNDIDFIEAELKETNLSATRLEKIKFNSANLYKANLSSSTFSNFVSFASSKMIRSNLDRCNCVPTVCGLADFGSADLTLSSFVKSELGNSNFSNAILELADLRGAKLRNSVGLTVQQIKTSVIDNETELPYSIAPDEATKRVLILFTEPNIIKREIALNNP